MNLGDIQAAIVDALDGTIRTSTYLGQVIDPPVAVVGIPDVDYDTVHADGEHQMLWPVWVLVGRPNDRPATALLAEFMSTANVAGHRSIKLLLEADATLGSVVSTVQVTGVEVSVITVADIDYLAAEFTVDVRVS